MSYRDMRSKPVEKWNLEEIRKALLTTDGIGIQLKTEAFNKLIENVDVAKLEYTK